MSATLGRSLAVLAIAVLAIAGLAACALRKPAPPPPALPPPLASPRLADSLGPVDASGETVVPYDLSGDGTPDLWVHSTATAPARVTRKELDMNLDGKPDLEKRYAADGTLELEAYDSDFDGQLDGLSFYEGGKLVRTERDEDHDGRRDHWVYYRDDTVVRIEEDRDGDGQPDVREEWDGGQRTALIELGGASDAGARDAG